MTYRYFSKNKKELFFDNFIDAVSDTNVYIIESINSIKINRYRSGSGWKKYDEPSN